MYNIIRTIRNITPRPGVLTACAAVFAALVLSLVIAGCEETVTQQGGDGTPPGPISISVAPGQTNDSVVITWTDPTDADFSHVFLYWTPAIAGVEQPLRVEKGVETATITGLSVGGYIFTAATVDTAGNISETSARVRASADIISPSVVTLTATAVVGGDVDVTWTDPSGEDFSHILLSWAPADGIDQPLRIDAGVQTATVTGLTDGIDYMFTATSVDMSGNQSVVSAASSATADATAPGAVNATAASGDNSTITLTWTDPTDADLSHILISWPDGNGGNLTSPLQIASGTETATVMHFTPGSIEFTVESVDDTGNTTSSTVTGTATADMTAPAGVTLGGTPTALINGGAEVTWTDPTDFDFSHILLSWMTTGGTAESRRVNKDIETATITGLTDGAAYMFTAKSVDTTGNESAVSTAVMVTADAAVPAVTGIAAIAVPGGAIVSWTDPTAADFSHVNITWNPVSGSQPLRVESGVQSTTLTGLTGGTPHTITATSVDDLGHEATATVTTTPTVATTPAVTAASATRINPAGATTVTWTDPGDTSGIAKIAITGVPAPTTAVEAAIGAGTASVTGLDPNVSHVIIISTLDSSDVASSTTTVTANATLPVALFSLGSVDGDFGFAACNTELAGSGAVAVAMRTAGYSKAVFFGSRGGTDAYDFIDLATNVNALGFSSTANATQLEARPVVVYTSANPTTTFGSPLVSRTIGNVVNVTTDGAWQNGGYTVVDDLTTRSFWSFTANQRLGNSHCNNATSRAIQGVAGITGGSAAIDGIATSSTSFSSCNAARTVICAAH